MSLVRPSILSQSGGSASDASDLTVQDWFGGRVSNLTMVEFGVPSLNELGTWTSISDPAGVWGRSTTAAVANSSVGGWIPGSFVVTQPQSGFRVRAKIRIPTSVADIRMGLFCSNGQMTLSTDTPTVATHYVGLMFRAGTDTGFRPVSRDGTTFNANDSQIGTVTVDTVYFLEIETVNGTSYTMRVYSGMGSLIGEVVHTANLPAATTPMAPSVQITPTVGSPKVLDVGPWRGQIGVAVDFA